MCLHICKYIEKLNTGLFPVNTFEEIHGLGEGQGEGDMNKNPKFLLSILLHCLVSFFRELAFMYYLCNSKINKYEWNITQP